MTETIRIKRGLNINLVGKAEKKLGDISQSETFALKPTDFIGLNRPKLLVKEGDIVRAGTPLFYDKMMENVQYTSPVSGEVVDIVRGEKRKLLEIKILADKEIKYESFPKFTVSDAKKLEKDDICKALCKSGIWPNIIQRPYGIVANPDDTPKNIFISGFDSHPLAPDYDFMFHGDEQYLQAGIDILKKLTPGQVHFTMNAGNEVSPIFTHLKDIILHKISGPHPAGNVGTQIHHIDPINKGDLVWTTTPMGLSQIGKLFLEGRYDAGKIIAITGSGIKTPQYFKTYTGACIDKMIENNLSNDHVRFVSGNVLTGEKIKPDGYLGFYHSQLTVIPEGDQYEMLGWALPTFKKLSIQRSFGLFSFLNPKSTEYDLNTNTRGDKRGFVQTNVLEKVFPMDILPTYLFKAIYAQDYDDMEELGIYELIEEDVALMEFVDVSKHDLQKILREGLDLLQYS